MANLNDFTQETLSAHLKRNPFIAEAHYFETVGSTNTIACHLALAGAREGEVVVADAQTKGRGRLDRVWQSPPGINLYTSLILRPRIEPAMAPQITLMAGVAVAELFSDCCPGGVTIKWPNDVLIGGRKACGILTEMKAAAGSLDFIILGIGLNINMDREDFDPSLRETATSLKIQTGKTLHRLDMISKLFDLIEKWYKVFLDAGFPGLREAWLRYADILGKRINVVYKDESQTGIVTGIDDDGTILMQREDGVAERVIAGDVHILRG
ncbi:MAG: biotin--[acetyl-CoA-carboxylase] ligase [Syntrophus sp. (in: bacteria)]|nr:biotin--[acetyl-CoA-carboxylase] ligase [Syntrophus sp. (in: bacteria)]